MYRRSTLALATFALAACSSEIVVAPEARAPEASFAIADGSSGQHLVVFAERAIPAGFADDIAAAGGQVVNEMPQIGVAVVAGLDDADVAAVRAIAGVSLVNVDPVLEMEPTAGDVVAEDAAGDAFAGTASAGDPTTSSFFRRQWHLRAIGADQAWAAGRLGSSAVKVFILDTGLDYTHPDLAGRVDLSLSRSFIASDNPVVQHFFPGAHPVADLHYHGTHVGATVSSNARAASGVTSNVTLVGVKVLSRLGRSVGSSVMSGMLYAADADADVVNMSLGGAFMKAESNEAFREAVHRTTEYLFDQGTVTVVSAGNSAIDLDHDRNGYKTYCSSTNVICVSATGPASQASVNGPWADIDRLSSYSNYGVSSISVAAPGGNGASRVTAACSRFSRIVTVCGTGTYVLGLNGTSMASPHVSGLAALLVEQIGRNKPAQVRAALAKSSDDLGKVGRDAHYGAGRINVAKALGL